MNIKYIFSVSFLAIFSIANAAESNENLNSKVQINNCYGETNFNQCKIKNENSTVIFQNGGQDKNLENMPIIIENSYKLQIYKINYVKMYSRNKNFFQDCITFDNIKFSTCGGVILK